MSPTLKVGDVFIEYQLSLSHRLKLDDIVTFISPVSNKLTIKRIIGLPGAIINNIVVPAGYVYLIGDNLENSYDSREHGPIEQTKICGKFIMKLTSLTEDELKKGLYLRKKFGIN